MKHAPSTADHGDHWRTDAACRALPDPDVMFPDHNVERIAAAKDVCRDCPVWRECLDTAMRAEGNRGTDHRWGVVAGLTEAQRAVLADLMTVTVLPAEPKPKRKPAAREPVRCGSRPGYRRHRAAGEEACDRCKAANTAADRRLRETGTTRAV